MKRKHIPKDWPPKMRTNIQERRMRRTEPDPFRRQAIGARCLFPSVIIDDRQAIETQIEDSFRGVVINSGGNGYDEFENLEAFDRLAILFAASGDMMRALQQIKRAFGDPRHAATDAQRQALIAARAALKLATELPPSYTP